MSLCALRQHSLAGGQVDFSKALPSFQGKRFLQVESTVQNSFYFLEECPTEELLQQR